MSVKAAAVKSCFVTGATGFVALNLIDELLGQGWRVTALHRSGSKRAYLLRELPNVAGEGNLDLVEGDLNMSAQSFALLVPDNIQVMFHICHVSEASSAINKWRVSSQPGFQSESSIEHKHINQVAMKNVIHASKTRGIRRIVYCSSWSSYGRQPNGTDVSETVQTHAHDVISASCCCCCGPKPSPVPYFECKLELEQQLCAAVAEGGVQGVIIQPCSVFGRYGDTGWCQIFDKLLQSKGEMPGLPGSSSFTDVQDLALAFVAAAEAGAGQGEK